jgi:hypothetical protein
MLSAGIYTSCLCIMNPVTASMCNPKAEGLGLYCFILEKSSPACATCGWGPSANSQLATNWHLLCNIIWLCLLHFFLNWWGDGGLFLEGFVVVSEWSPPERLMKSSAAVTVPSKVYSSFVKLTLAADVLPDSLN